MQVRCFVTILLAVFWISTCLANPFLGHRHVRQGLPEVLLQTFASRQDDTSHISDYTHQPKANSNADAPKKLRPTTDGQMSADEKPAIATTEAPPGFQLENLGVLASSIGSLFNAAPNIIQTAVKNLPIVKQNPKIFARNVERPEPDSDNEISSDLTTASTDIEDLASDEKSTEDDSSKKPSTPTSHAPPPPPPPTQPQELPEIEPQEEGNIFTRFLTTVKSGFYLLKAVLLPPPKHDPKAIEPPNTAFVTALENVMAFIQPILTSRQPTTSRSKRDVDESQERFYSLVERTVLDRFRFDSDVQALQAKIIFRESFVRYAGIDLLSELTEERIKHMVKFLKGLNQYRNQTMDPNEDGADNSLPLRKSENGDINFAFFEKSANSESIFILFVEVLGTVAGLAWGTFSQFLWLISNMNS